MVVVGRVKEKERDAVGLLGAAGAEQLGPKVLLEPFVDEFDELLGQYPNEYEEMGLDEVLVGAIAPIVSFTSFPRVFRTKLTSLAVPSPLPRLGSPLASLLRRRRAQAVEEAFPH